MLRMTLAMMGLLGGGLAACKEGEGSRCQIDSDCKSGLVCNRATDTCQDSADIDPDASFQPDAMLPQDAADDAADATTDATTDAPQDAVTDSSLL